MQRPRDRNDTSLLLGLSVGALVIFIEPLRALIETGHLRRPDSLSLFPGLAILVGSLAYHYLRSRRDAGRAAAAAAAEAAQERARSAHLERLVGFSRSLGGALEPASIRDVFWRYLPGFADNREVWMLTHSASGGDAVFSDATAARPETARLLESLARQALNEATLGEVSTYGALLDDYLCFPMLVGQTAVGVVGVRNDPPLVLDDHGPLSAAVALLAIAIRNGQLLFETRESSIRDGLTGCYNRTYGVEALSTELHRAARIAQPVSVLMIDIDEFKTVNDRHGHLVGDTLLAALGARLSQVLRSSDIKCRYGGDEFFVILPETPLAGAEHVAATLTRELATLAVPSPGGTVAPTISTGIAIATKGETDATAIIARADAALYRAKRAGRNQFAAAV
jgi:diguanylate cyclase (GGDEF)-like protein